MLLQEPAWAPLSCSTPYTPVPALNECIVCKPISQNPLLVEERSGADPVAQDRLWRRVMDGKGTKNEKRLNSGLLPLVAPERVRAGSGRGLAAGCWLLGSGAWERHSTL